MKSRGARKLITGLLVLSMLPGCRNSDKTLHYLGDTSLKYYKDHAQQIDYPCINEPIPEEVKVSDQPRVLNDRRRDEVWDLTLIDAIHLALANNRVIRVLPRTGGGIAVDGDPRVLSQQPEFLPSIYDPAIQESGVLFGGIGVEAALAAFDAQLNTSMVWGRDEQIVNSPFFGNAPGSTRTEDTAVFQSALTKQFAYGATFAVGHDWNYSGVNTLALLFPSSYTGNVRAEYRQPLLAGSGADYTRIAGPANPNFGAITGVSQGVVIARINNDIEIADFEASVRDLLSDVENLYWDLYLAYRNYDTAVTARNSALRSWREAKAILDVGGKPNFKPADEAQALEQYYASRAATENALTVIYQTEVRLRYLIGMPVNDGRIIRPADEPTVGQFIPDWFTSLTEALTERVELRRQKWTIKSLELQLVAANSLTRPRLDFVSGYRVNGFGDTLLSQSDNDGITAQGLNSAYETITQGDQTGWNLGFEMSMPLGFRSAHAQVRNIELRLVKAKEVLSVQEQNIAMEVAEAFQALANHYATAQSNLNRRRAAQRRVDLFQSEFEVGTVTLDQVLRAQTSLAQAESDYYRSLTEYNIAIANLHFRKGTLFDYNNVFLAEGQWTPQAYREATRRAWARSHALDCEWLDTEPGEFVVPPGGSRQPVDLAFPPSEDSGEIVPVPESNGGQPLPPPPAPPAEVRYRDMDEKPLSEIKLAPSGDETVDTSTRKPRIRDRDAESRRASDSPLDFSEATTANSGSGSELDFDWPDR